MYTCVRQLYGRWFDLSSLLYIFLKENKNDRAYYYHFY